MQGVCAMTEKLYYLDSHMQEFTARIADVDMDEKGILIALDRTAFFPEGGGQLPDTGFIAQSRVSDVQEKDGIIWHRCSDPLPVGAEVPCRIDWPQRIRRMHSHSGEHIVSGVAHRLYGCDNVGFHMGEEAMTIDFNLELSWDELMEVEKRANEAVRKDLPVKAWLPEQEDLHFLAFRSKLELTENVRVVEIEGYDLCACCAPHVSRTGEIGVIKILDSTRHRGGVRISLICGEDAYNDYRLRQESVTEISRLLSAKREDVAPAVQRILRDNLAMKEKCDRLSMELVRVKAEAAESTEGSICVFDSVLDEVAQRELTNLLMEKCGRLACVFCGSDEEGWRYIIGSKNIDLRKNTKAVNAAIEGRGGGSVQMIQGRAMGKKSTIEENIKNLQL